MPDRYEGARAQGQYPVFSTPWKAASILLEDLFDRPSRRMHPNLFQASSSAVLVFLVGIAEWLGLACITSPHSSTNPYKSWRHVMTCDHAQSDSRPRFSHNVSLEYFICCSCNTSDSALLAYFCCLPPNTKNGWDDCIRSVWNLTCCMSHVETHFTMH